MKTMAQIRRSLGMTQDDLATKIGVSQSLISLIENNNYDRLSRSPELRAKIAATLNTTEEEIFLFFYQPTRRLIVQTRPPGIDYLTSEANPRLMR